MSAAALRHSPPLSPAEWLKAHLGTVMESSLVGSIASWFLARPKIMVKWVQESQQVEYPDRELQMASLVVRLVSGLILAMAFLMLANILAAPPNAR
jgi:hypothetical protein